MRAEILGRERRRRWTDEQKLEIIGAVGVNGVLRDDQGEKRVASRKNVPERRDRCLT